MRLLPYNASCDLDRCMAQWGAASETGPPFLDAATLDSDALVIRDRYMPAAEINVAERDGTVIGFIAIVGDLVGGLFVDPAAHRSGAGRALIGDAIRRKGRLEVEVYEANAGARAFYAACGFVEAGRRDSGHAITVPVEGDFMAHVGFDGDYQALYDQAVLKLRQDEANWIKAGIELSDGVANLSVVVTRGASDWSTLALNATPGPQRLRLTRLGGAVVIQARNVSNRGELLRVTPFPEGPARIGPMARSPERAAIGARLTEFSISPAVAQALHDESLAT